MAKKDEEFRLYFERQEDSGKYWIFRFPKLPQSDKEIQLDGSRGTWCFEGGDRVAYHTAYCFLMHNPPGGEETQAARCVFQIYGNPTGDAPPVRIVDWYMSELNPQGLAPYPYEGRIEINIDRSRPGRNAVFLMEQKHLPDARRAEPAALIAEFEVPPISYENEKVKWYYQLGGLWVAEHDDFGIVSRIIMTAMHPRYTIGVRDPKAQGVRWREDDRNWSVLS